MAASITVDAAGKMAAAAAAVNSDCDNGGPQMVPQAVNPNSKHTHPTGLPHTSTHSPPSNGGIHPATNNSVLEASPRKRNAAVVVVHPSQRHQVLTFGSLEFSINDVTYGDAQREVRLEVV